MSNREEWSDDVLKMADYVHKYVEFFMRERAQLYGTIIYLMILNNTRKIELPPPATFNSYGREFYIKYDLDKEGIATMTMLDRPEPNE